MGKKINNLVVKMVAEAIKEATLSAESVPARNENDLLTDSQTAKVLGIAKGTLPVWRHHGKGPKFVKIGTNVRYKYSELQKYIENHTF